MLRVLPEEMQASTLKITRVEAIPLRLPLARSLKIAIGAERTSLDVVIVRVHTNEGIIGIGETQAWRRQGGAEILVNLVNTIENHFGPLIVGQSPFNVSGILNTLEGAYSNTLYAQAAVSDAFQDLVGKASGLPLRRLLGGECRTQVRLGVILTIKPTVEEVLAAVEEGFERGIRYFGLKIGVDPARDVENVAAIRHRFGNRIALRVDANAAMGRDGAISLLKKLEQYDLDAVEQPVASWDIEGLAAIARAISAPVMVDESLSTEHSLMEIIRRRAATGVHTKLAKNGGVFRTWRLWTIAEAAGMRICPGNHPCTGVATAAALQMCAAFPNELIDGAFAVGVGGELETDITTHSFVIKDGAIEVPPGAGLGVDLDMDKVEHFRVH
jgi:L-alanine-DL-glutamate epimerase-like enolase superfamily enzyme